MRSTPDDSTPDAAWSALRLPFGAGELVEKVVGGAANQIGRRTLYLLLTTWDAAGGGPFAATAIGTVGLDTAVQRLQDQFAANLFNRVLKAVGADRVRLRAALAASQLVGVGVMRYAARTEPLASTDVSVLVNALAPTLQRYLVGEID
ncbi:MAG: hypothetical protein ACRDQB_06715 [Thermocrispum sp.]